MSASSSSDCYLCGARNDPDASYCERCNGQLLRIPVDEQPEEAVSIDSIVDDITEAPDINVDTPAEKPRPRGRKGSLQDQRLSDALGLSDGPTSIEPNLVDTVVTSIPRATPSASIPLLGTRSGAVPQSSLSSSEFGKRTYVLLGLLLIATAWLGYSTLAGKDSTPDSIAFTGTTAPPTSTTTTTEKPERVWKANEVEGRYSFALVRLDLIRCPTSKDDEIDVVETTGVNLTTNNVVFNANPMPGADLAIIKNRTGAQRLAIIESLEPGVAIATTMTPTSRNLGIDPSVEPGSSAFFVAYDPTTNVVTTTTERQALPVQIQVGSNGEALAVLLDLQTISIERLSGIDTRIETKPDYEVPNNPSDCEIAQSLQVVGAPTSLDSTQLPKEADE